jgi:hypothetical protein
MTGRFPLEIPLIMGEQFNDYACGQRHQSPPFNCCSTLPARTEPRVPPFTSKVQTLPVVPTVSSEPPAGPGIPPCPGPDESSHGKRGPG